MNLNTYIEKVYAGVLGKIIGVYMGRPVEGWSYEKIREEIGDIWYYIHDKIGLPLVVTDDDISGTFTFVRAAENRKTNYLVSGNDVADAWLNYIIENRTILWWGGKGVSTEHTAFLALKNGIDPPQSGSIMNNGKIVAEQIGAQIFIDAWAMLAPGKAELAKQYAMTAAQVSHDGEAVHGAIMVAVMESLAFVESDTECIFKKALTYIPQNSVIYTMNSYILELYHRESDWRKAWEEYRQRYNYAMYPGVCHVVPNHGLVMLSLLYGGDDFQKTQMIVNSCGWDTDCNAANAGCYLGIKNGLIGLDAGADFRSPVRDRLYLPTADGGRSINDALSVTYDIVNMYRSMNGENTIHPKNGARFHFSQPGAVQGFQYETAGGEAPQPRLDTVMDDSVSSDHMLRCRFKNLGRGQHVRIMTATFIPLEAREMPGYEFIASPTLYAGNTIRVRCYLKESTGSVEASLFVQANGDDDNLLTRKGKKVQLEPCTWYELTFTVGDTGGQPVTFVGIELKSPNGGSKGTLYIDSFTWDDVVRTDLIPLQKPKGKVWVTSWVSSLDLVEHRWRPGVSISKDSGLGLFYQGTTCWRAQHIEATIIPNLFKRGGLVLGVQGLRRFVSIVFNQSGTIELSVLRDRKRDILDSQAMEIEWGKAYQLSVECIDNSLVVLVDGIQRLSADIGQGSLLNGAIGLLVESGSLTCMQLSVITQ